MKGMVVYVGRPINCERCKGTGRVTVGFVHGPNGPICPECNWAKLTREAMPLEDFAKLFTYGAVRGYDEKGQLYERNEVRVAENGGDAP